MVEGDRPRGRPAKRWSDDIVEWCGRSLPEAVQLASITELASLSGCKEEQKRYMLRNFEIRIAVALIFIVFNVNFCTSLYSIGLPPFCSVCYRLIY